MLKGSVTASLIGYFIADACKGIWPAIIIEISSLLEKISRGLYYERMKLSYLCTAEYHLPYICQYHLLGLKSQFCLIYAFLGLS